MNKTLKTLLILPVLGFAGIAQATVFNINMVMGGSSGFGASSFHDAGDSTPMTGAILRHMDEVSGAYGTYDDVTGILLLSGVGIVGGGSFTLGGTLDFDGAGLLDSNSTVAIGFAGGGLPAQLVDTNIGFLPGYICCGSTAFDPNSFQASGSDMIMTLWGADFRGAIFEEDFAGDYTGSTFGMDLRLKMTAATVPEPSILALLSLGLIGLGFTRSKKS